MIRLFGWLCIAIAVLLGLFSLFGYSVSKATPERAVAVVFGVLSLLLLIIGIRAVRRRSRKSAQPTRSWIGGSGGTVCFVGHWCDTPIKFSNTIKTPLGSSVSKVNVCLDIWYTVVDGKIEVDRAELSKAGSSVGGNGINIATMKGEAFYVDNICDKEFLKQAAESDVEKDQSLQKRMLSRWRKENG